MTQARELFREGKLNQAVGSLQAYLRDKPGDPAGRIFLFELCCFTGDFVRAARQLDALSACDGDFESLSTLYGAALRAEHDRQALLPPGSASAETVPVSGVCNGRPFSAICDADTATGQVLEFIGGAEFHRIPFQYLKRVVVSPPARLRDLYFLPASVATGDELNNFVFERVFLPCIYTGSFLAESDDVKLGRATAWIDGPGGASRVAGQRLLRLDDDVIALTEVTTIDFHHAVPPGDAGA